ncbi:MAG: hypothetical protein ACU0A6_15750, partial [Shimia sp.]|uniref:hypothetical protein n=1 Tax=Shimia sp. TaxID=1954381 RepID=UPI004057D840
MLTQLHRGAAVLLGLFVVLHLGTHLFLTQGLEAHLGVLEATRPIYRQAVIEPILLVLFAVQIVLGLSLVVRRGWPSGGWAWAQVLSGLYVALFLTIHVSAALMARSKYGVDFTNSYWAAAVVSRAPYVFMFAPYYWLAVASIFVHTGNPP